MALPSSVDINNKPDGMRALEPWFACYAPGPEVGDERQIVWHLSCQSPDCDRFACTASEPGFVNFCCKGCAEDARHSADCTRLHPGRLTMLIPGMPAYREPDSSLRHVYDLPHHIIQPRHAVELQPVETAQASANINEGAD